MTSFVNNQGNLAVLLAKDLRDRANYLAVRHVLAGAMNCIFRKAPPGKHYNNLFAKLTDKNWKAVVDNCSHDLIMEDRTDSILDDEPELLRHYLILHTRGRYDRISYLIEQGIIELKPLVMPSNYQSNVKLYNSGIKAVIDRYEESGLNCPDLARMMYNVMVVIAMGSVPKAHYDKFFSKLSDYEIVEFGLWLKRQTMAQSQGKLSRVQEIVLNGAKLYLHYFTNKPSKYYNLFCCDMF